MAVSLRRLPLVRQAEATECGLACLAMVAGFHGYRTSLNALRLQFPVSLSGSTLSWLLTTAARMGLAGRPLRLGQDELCRLQLPAVLHWNLNHFVVLRAVRGDRCVIHDPARGVLSCTRADLSRAFTGVALELQPAPGFRRRDECTCVRLSDLWSGARGIVPSLAQILVMSLVVQLFALASPLYLQLVVDEVLTKNDVDLLAILALGFGLFMLISEAASALRSFVILHLGSQLDCQVMSNLVRHLLHLPIGWFEKRHVGDVLSRLGSTEPVRRLFSEGLVAAVIDGGMAAGTLALMLAYSPVLAALVVCANAAYVTLRLALFRAFRDRSEDAIAARAIEQSAMIESLRGVLSIRVYGREAERHALWQNRRVESINAGVRLGRLQVACRAANGVLFGIENVLVIWLGALQVTAQSLTVGMLLAFVAYRQHFTSKATALVERLIEFRLLGLHLERIGDITAADAEDVRPPSAVPALRRERTDIPLLAVEHLAFAYAESERRILDDVSFTVQAGEMVAITGRSGCGKSTLIKLLLGLYPPDAGSIRFRGVSVRNAGRAGYRRRIGAVLQNDVLMSGSIADNIAFFDPEPDYTRMRQCAVLAAIDGEICRMPMGYASLVGDMGTALSAGQRQRVLLARALYRRPEILVMDEGTAHLDVASEREVIRAIRRAGVACVCVAHRRQILQASDRVVTLVNGVAEIRAPSAVLAPRP